MRVLQCSDAYYPFPGGVSEHLHELTEALRRRGHQVDILTAWYPGSPEREEGVYRVGRVVILKASKVFNLTQLTITTITPSVAKEVKRIVRRGYDIVHVHGPYAPNLPYLAAKYALSPVVATHHTAFVGFNWHKIGRFFFRNIGKKVAVNIGVSQVAVREIAPYYPGRYTIIPNGVNTRRFRPDAPRPKIYEALKGPVVLYVGRMEPRKGFPRLAAAWPLVKRAVPEAQLVAVGKGPQLEEYKALVKDFADSVHFVGYVPGDELPGYYAGASVYTSPAVGGETFGIVLVEAMASGAPVVASNISGYAQVIKHGVNGLLVDTQNPEAYAEALISVLKNPELARQLREEGFKTAERYSWDRVAEQVEALYERVLNEIKG